jgi:hypothetical protein
MIVHRATTTRFAVAYLLFTVAAVMVPKADIQETPFDEANIPTNEMVVEKAASSWEYRQSVTALIPTTFVQERTISVRSFSLIHTVRLTDSRTLRELFCCFRC